MKSQVKILRILEKTLFKAEHKHPLFANYATSKSKSSIDTWVEELKQSNDKSEKANNSSIEKLALEELVEFLQAVKNKDKKQAVQEAIDLAVVALRAAEWAMYEL